MFYASCSLLSASCSLLWAPFSVLTDSYSIHSVICYVSSNSFFFLNGLCSGSLYPILCSLLMLYVLCSQSCQWLWPGSEHAQLLRGYHQIAQKGDRAGGEIQLQFSQDPRQVCQKSFFPIALFSAWQQLQEISWPLSPMPKLLADLQGSPHIHPIPHTCTFKDFFKKMTKLWLSHKYRNNQVRKGFEKCMQIF